jgi:hypothetical protein
MNNDEFIVQHTLQYAVRMKNLLNWRNLICLDLKSEVPQKEPPGSPALRAHESLAFDCSKCKIVGVIVVL